MTFKEAAAFVMPFGKYKSSTLDSIASTDEGLLYLDYMRGELSDGPALRAISVYLDDPSIKRELEGIGE